MSVRAASALALAVLLGTPAFGQKQPPIADEKVVELPIRNGVSQRVLYAAPSQPLATLIMLPGGSGDIGLRHNGGPRHGNNFLVRTRRDWVARNFAVLIPDTVDHRNLRGSRSSLAYGQLVDELAAYARTRVTAPVFLIGTSQGTIAAMNGATHAAPGAVSGLVLTESVSAPGWKSTETVFDANPQSVRVPVLIVANRNDQCKVASPELASRIAAALTGAPNVRVLTFSGGVQRSQNDCGSLSPHGYYGIEQDVIGGISEWLQAHGR